MMKNPPQIEAAIKDFVEKGVWPKPGVLPTKLSFNRGLRAT